MSGSVNLCQFIISLLMCACEWTVVPCACAFTFLVVRICNQVCICQNTVHMCLQYVHCMCVSTTILAKGPLCSLTFLITLHKGNLMNAHRDRQITGEHRWGTVAPSCQSASTIVTRLTENRERTESTKRSHNCLTRSTSLSSFLFPYFVIPVSSSYATASFFSVNCFALSAKEHTDQMFF